MFNIYSDFWKYFQEALFRERKRTEVWCFHKLLKMNCIGAGKRLWLNLKQNLHKKVRHDECLKVSEWIHFAVSGPR